MSNHSIKVPRLYKEASKILKEVKENGASIKNLLYQVKHPNVKAIYSLVLETLKKSKKIEELFKRSQILTKENGLNIWLAQILITELLWGKKRLPSDSKPVKTILAYQQVFNAHLSDLTDDNEYDFTNKVVKPRYVRVNTLKISVNEAIDGFRDEGWKLKRFLDKNNYESFIEQASSLESDEFMVDIHLNDLLLFPPKTEFYQHDAYKSGAILLQDKASCLPVFVLNPPPESVVLDMCAAPGMKTTQIAAMLNNKGIVYAVDKDEKRFETLNEIVEQAGASCVQTIKNDVLCLGAGHCPNIEYILVDPTCSGSGMTDRLDVRDCKNPESRIQNLSGFQIKLLKHALSNFPHAKRVVYSTCSIYPEENEFVVKEVLASRKQFKLLPVSKFLNNSQDDNSEFNSVEDCCFYTKPENDLTNGFFIAVFERKEVEDTSKERGISKKNKKRSKNPKFDEYDRKKKNKLQAIEDVVSVEEKSYENTSKIDNQEELHGSSGKSKSKKKKKFYETEEVDSENLGNKNGEQQIEKNENISKIKNQEELHESSGKSKSKKKKKKFHETEEVDSQNVENKNGEQQIENQGELHESSGKSKSKKKKKKFHETEEVDSENIENTKGEQQIERNENTSKIKNQEEIHESSCKSKSKKKKKKFHETEDVDSENVENKNEEQQIEKKVPKKRKQFQVCEENDASIKNVENQEDFEETNDIKIHKKKKKKFLEVVDVDTNEIKNEEELNEDKGKKKKKKKENKN